MLNNLAYLVSDCVAKTSSDEVSSSNARDDMTREERMNKDGDAQSKCHSCVFHGKQKRKKERKIKGGTMSILNITDRLSQENFYLDIIHIDDDVYKDEIPLSHKDSKGISIIIRNHDNEQDLPIALLRIYRSTDANIGEIADVFVHPNFRGKCSPLGMKWSHLILDIGLKKAKEKINIIWLWTTEDNVPAITLYKCFEFQEFTNSKVSKTIKAKHTWIGEKNIVLFIKEI